MTAVIDRPPDGDVHVPVPIGCRIAQDVLIAAAAQPVGQRTEEQPNGDSYTFHTCLMCDQSIGGASVRRNGKVTNYAYNVDAVQTLMLCHLMQTHGWTREKIGER